MWVPAGGVPIYASTSTGSAVVDRLHTGGTANWFYCSESGGTASSGGYSSTNWARTIGDDNAAQGYVPAIYFDGVQNYWHGLSGCSSPPPPPPADNSCTPSTNSAGVGVYYCPIWLPSGGVPVYSGTSTTSGVVDHLHTGGSANWFYCSVNGSTATVSGASSSNWAKTVGDDNGATGYVPAVYFTGAQNYWPSLTACSGSTNNPPPPPTSNGGSTSSGSLACHGHTVSYTSLPALTISLLTHGCALQGTYSWGGGHVGTPGPSYGHYDGSDPASLHDNTVLGMDCSGFVRYAYYLTTGNDALNGYTGGQWNLANALPKQAVANTGGSSTWSVNTKGNWVGGPSAVGYESQLKVGDVLWYGHGGSGHIAIYIGNGLQVNAYQSGDPYGVTSVWTYEFWGYVRLWQRTDLSAHKNLGGAPASGAPPGLAR